MARPRVEFPTPVKRLKGRSWQICWTSGGRFFGMSAGLVDEREAESRRLEVALALRTGRWPAWTADSPAVKRWQPAMGKGPAEVDAPLGGLLAAYEPHIRGEVGSGKWATNALAHLRALEAFAGHSLDAVTSREAQAFLDSILSTPGPRGLKNGKRSAGTRNRALAACSKFYKWAARTGRIEASPFAGIPMLREHPAGEIVYLTRKERARLLEAALRLSSGLAVWIALYAGMRRGEIARAAWADVNLKTGVLSIPRAKRGHGRILPIAAELSARLEKVPARKRRGRIVPWPDGEAQWAAASERLIDELVEACPEVPAERIGWNVFRHTFATLLVQSGVSLDKVSAWMGNSPGICRRHYAAFVPRDRRDNDIDRL